MTLPPGVYRFDSPIAIPPHTVVELAPGTTLECHVTGGAPAITLDNGAKLCARDGGAGGAQIVAHAGCEIAALVTNSHHDGTQEYGYVEGLFLIAHSGAKVSSALVDLVSLFVNSGIRDCVIVGNHTAPTGLRIRGGTKTGFGPVFVDNVWVATCTGHNIVISEENPQRGSGTCWLRNITCENQGAGHHGLVLEGHGGLFNVSITNFHYEHGTPADSPTAAIYVDGVPGVSLDGVDVLCEPVKNKLGIVIARNPLNMRARIRGVQNVNGVAPVLEDRLHDISFGARSVSFYENGDAASVEHMFGQLVRMPGGIALKTKAGPISDADFGAGVSVPDGTMAVDTAGLRLFVRIGGSWRSTPLA